MSLWAKIQQLPANSIHLQKIRDIYSDNFPIEVRHSLAQFIEEKFWTDIELRPENATTSVENIVSQLIQEIENKSLAEGSNEVPEYFLIKLKLAETAQIFRQRFSQNPLQLFNFIRHCLTVEMKYLQDAGADFIEIGPILVVSESASEVFRKLEDLKCRTISTAEDMRKLEQQQEVFALLYHGCTNVNAHLQQLQYQGMCTGPDQKTLQVINEQELMEQDLNRRVAKLLEFRIRIVKNLRQTYQYLTQLQNQIIDDKLVRWMRDQQLSGNGVPFITNLDQIQDWCESLAEIIWQNRQQIKELERLKQNLALDPPGVFDALSRILTDITQLLSSLITSTFIIEKQPLQVMKTNARFTATI